MSSPLRTDLSVYHRFGVIEFSFSFVWRYVLISFLISLLTHSPSSNMCLCGFLGFLLSLIPSFIPLSSENILDIISISLNILRLVLWPNIWLILENIPQALGKDSLLLWCQMLWKYKWNPSGLCVRFSVLGRSAVSPSLRRGTLLGSCPLGPSGHLPDPLHQVLQRCLLCVLCAPSSCRRALIAAGVSVGGAGPQDDWLSWLALATAHKLLCSGPTEQAGFAQGALVLAWTTLWVLFVELLGWCSVVVWSQPLGMLVMGPLGRGS